MSRTATARVRSRLTTTSVPSRPPVFRLASFKYLSLMHVLLLIDEGILDVRSPGLQPSFLRAAWPARDSIATGPISPHQRLCADLELEFRGRPALHVARIDARHDEEIPAGRQVLDDIAGQPG